MSETILVTTQAEMDAAIVRQEGDPLVRIEVCGSVNVYIYDSATVYVYDSARVTASGSASVTASGSARVTASDSASVSAFGSASVIAFDSARVYASDSATVSASGFVTVLRLSPNVVVLTGGRIPDFSTPLGWCEYAGAAEASAETRILYKGLDSEFRSAHGTVYLPGTEVVAPDWDDGEAECGGGLHFCASAAATLQFADDAAKFVACEVALADMAAHEFPQYPSKIKARAARVLYECDVHGERVVK